MRIALTGASGFIGRNLSGTLVASGYEIAPLENADVLVHLAGIAHRRGVDRQQLERVNVELAERMGQAAARAGCRMLFVSTVKVHGEESVVPLTESAALAPRDAYAESKARAEERLRAIPGLKLTVVRPPLVYGPGVKANFLALTKAIARGIPLPLAGIANRRSLVYVGNLADAILRCIETPQAVGRTYLVSDGAAVSTPQLCRAIGEALGRPARLFRFPEILLFKNLKASLEVDDSAIRAELGWRPPYTLEQGLASLASPSRRPA